MKKLTVAAVTALVALGGVLAAPAAVSASAVVASPCCKAI